MSTKNFSPIGPAVWPAIGNIYMTVLFYYIEEDGGKMRRKNILSRKLPTLKSQRRLSPFIYKVAFTTSENSERIIPKNWSVNTTHYTIYILLSNAGVTNFNG